MGRAGSPGDTLPGACSMMKGLLQVVQLPKPGLPTVTAGLVLPLTASSQKAVPVSESARGRISSSWQHVAAAPHAAGSAALAGLLGSTGGQRAAG